MDYAATIEKNRFALLRIVALWLVVARCISRTRVFLPLRLSRYIGSYLFKMEASLGYLIQVSTRHVGLYAGESSVFLLAATRHRAGLGALAPNDRLSLETIITRLRALRVGLRQLASKPTPKSQPVFSAARRRFTRARLCCVATSFVLKAQSLPP